MRPLWQTCNLECGTAAKLFPLPTRDSGGGGGAQGCDPAAMGREGLHWGMGVDHSGYPAAHWVYY